MVSHSPKVGILKWTITGLNYKFYSYKMADCYFKLELHMEIHNNYVSLSVKVRIAMKVCSFQSFYTFKTIHS